MPLAIQREDPCAVGEGGRVAELHGLSAEVEEVCSGGIMRNLLPVYLQGSASWSEACRRLLRPAGCLQHRGATRVHALARQPLGSTLPATPVPLTSFIACLKAPCQQT